MERYGEGRTSDEFRAHMNEIRDITERWQRGEISLSAKRAHIAMLNSAFHGPGHKGESGQVITDEPLIPDEIAYALADGMGLPLEAATRALAARRAANRRAAFARTEEESRRAIAEGQESYEAILRAARGW